MKLTFISIKLLGQMTLLNFFLLMFMWDLWSDLSMCNGSTENCFNRCLRSLCLLKSFHLTFLNDDKVKALEIGRLDLNLLTTGLIGLIVISTGCY